MTREQPVPVVLIAGCKSESSGIPMPGVYTMGLPIGLEWATGSPRTLGHSVGGGEEAEHTVTRRKGSDTHPIYHQVLETAKALKKLTFRYMDSPGSSPGGGNGNPLQYSCLGKPMDRGAWQAPVHGVTKSRTRLSTHACTHALHSKLESVLEINLSNSPYRWGN